MIRINLIHRWEKPAQNSHFVGHHWNRLDEPCGPNLCWLNWHSSRIWELWYVIMKLLWKNFTCQVSNKKASVRSSEQKELILVDWNNEKRTKFTWLHTNLSKGPSDLNQNAVHLCRAIKFLRPTRQEFVGHFACLPWGIFFKHSSTAWTQSETSLVPMFPKSDWALSCP